MQSLTPEQAIALVDAKAALGPSKPKRGARSAAKPAPKSTKRAAPKRASGNKAKA